MAVYSDDRVRRMRMVLVIILVLAALLGAFAAFLLVRGHSDDRTAGVLGAVIAAAMLGTGGTAYRLLGAAERPAKVACVVAAVVTVLSGFGLVGTWLAFLLPLIGVGLLFLAVLADPEAAG